MTPFPPIEDLPRTETLWISPHPYDAILSGAARMARDAAGGAGGLLATVFGQSDPGRLMQAAARLRLSHVHLGLQAAHARQRHYASLTARTYGSHESDSEVRDAVRQLFDAVARQVRPRNVFVPLGVGLHIDHRLVHEAAEAAFPGGPGQNVFYYEDRPYALIPGAVRVRLAQLAVRLPPAITALGDGGSLLSHLFGFNRSSIARHGTRGIADRMAFLGRVASSWHQSRAWNPRRAIGLRLQPTTDVVDSALADAVDDIVSELAPAATRLIGSPKRYAHLAARHASRLGHSRLAERYWLRLPALHDEDVVAYPLEEG